MKVLHLIAGDLTGGAAKGAYWLHKGLIHKGVESRILTNSKTTLGDNLVKSVGKSTFQKLKNSFRSRIDSLPARFYWKRKKHIFSTGIIGYDFINHPLYNWADIVHFHWVNEGFVNIKDLSKVKKPILWTVRDMWLLTGGCHYSLECKRYTIGCGKCVQLNSHSENDLSKMVINRKADYIPKNLVLVCISNWLEKCARNSYLFKDFEIRMISNNISCQEFYPVERKKALDILGLPQNCKIILAGAQNINDYYKGFEKFIEAVEIVNSMNNLDILVVFFGRLDNSIINSLRFKCKSFGYINDSATLRLLYSASDVFVAPSLYDAFGKTLAEAMACGTPVVCFDTSGPKDIVDHKKNGYLAKPFDPVDLATGIEWVLENEDSKSLSVEALKKVRKNFDANKVAEEYLLLYQKMLLKHNMT